MIGVRHGLAAAVVGLAVLLVGLAAAPGIGPGSGAAGLACGALLAVAVARSAREAGVVTWGPADLVTLTRATLACGIVALVAEAALADPAVDTLATLAVVALALDAVDGPVARRTGTVSPFGARLDGEADAFLMLVLSVYVAAQVGAYVLAIGVVRYAFAAAGWVLPWMRADLPPRYWRKVVTAIAGIALAVAAAEVVPEGVTHAALGLAVLLLAESFGRDVRWLWHQHRQRHDVEVVEAVGAAVPTMGPARRGRPARLPSP